VIHSLALDRSVWDGVVDTMKNEAEILTYDCRGHGRSERRAGTFTAELFATDLAELLDCIYQRAHISRTRSWSAPGRITLLVKDGEVCPRPD